MKGDYIYGIDENLLSRMLNFSELRKKMIYFSYTAICSYNLTTEPWFPREIAIVLIIYILKNKYNVDFFPNGNTEVSEMNILKKIEEFRSTTDQQILKDNILGFLLSLIPTKYFYKITTYAILHKGDYEFMSSVPILKNKLEQAIRHVGLDYNIPIEITQEFLNSKSLTCNLSILSSGLEWCTHVFESNKLEDKNCLPSNYFSGFYNIEPPVLNRGVLRRPEDLKYIIPTLIENKNLTKEYTLLSDYSLSNNMIKWKLHNKDGLFTNDILNKFTSLIESNGYNISSIKNKSYYSNFIWKLLIVGGIEAPISFAKFNNISNDEMKEINKIIKEISKNNNIITNITNMLKNIIRYCNDSDVYKIKYLKYKQKYLELKNKLN